MYRNRGLPKFMKSRLHKVPFLRLLLPFVAGVVIQERFRVDQNIILIVFTVLSALLLVTFLTRISENFRWNLFYGILGNCVLFSGGMKLTTQNALSSKPENIRAGCIMYIPEEKEKTFKMVLGNLKEKLPEGWRAIDGKALVYLKKSGDVYNLEPGDQLLFQSTFQLIEGPANPMEFDFGRYCLNLGIFWKTYPGDNEWIKLKDKKRIFSLSGAERIRLKIVRYTGSKNLANESLINSLLLGYREGLTGEQQKYFAASGAMHILAVSGMHVAIIYGALVFVAGIFLTRKSGWILLFPLPVIWLYAFITGMTPSVARSAIMISLYVISRFLNRKTDSLNVLLACAFFMIAWQPLVMHQVSFQLSFAAVAGITLGFQGLYRRLKTGFWLPDQVISICCLSVAAQLFTFPLSVYYFHQFPNYFLITNLFAVPLSGIILIIGFVFIFSFFSLPVSSFIGMIVDKITGLLDYLTRIAGTLPFSTTGNLTIAPFEVIMTYLVILLLLHYFRTRKVQNLHFILSLMAIILSVTSGEMIRQSDTKEVIVPSVQGNTVINFISGTNNLVLTDDTSSEARTRIISHMNNYWCSHRLDDPEFVSLQSFSNSNLQEKGVLLEGSEYNNLHYIQFCNIKIGILDDRFRLPVQPKISLNLDLLIISLKGPVQVSELKNYLNPGDIIIDRNVPAWITKRIESECIKYKMPYHNIYTSGYFKMEL
jgi:competence protein ComEC